MLLIVSLVTLMLSVWTGLELARGNRSIKALKDLPPVASAPPPIPTFVSVIIPARNEASSIRAALTSVLNQDYPNYEVIVLDDRSEDRTGVIIDELAKTAPTLHVLHIAALPDGWLGKNYALYVGTTRAKGSVYLFADADVSLERSALSRAVRALDDARLDHLTVLPQLRIPSVAFELFVTGFTVLFFLFFKPWNARDPDSPSSIGIGAFNLIRAEAYRTIGTHRAIAMRPDDDMKLGKLVKQAGLRQDVFLGLEMVSLQWYASVRDMVHGLTKNSFAGMNYSVARVMAAITGEFVWHLWPFLALVLTRGVVQLCNGVIVATLLFTGWDQARRHHVRPWCGIGYPFASLLLSYILVRSMVTTLMQGGIVWRGTRYDLERLKANRM